MPEMPEIQAHAERLTARFAGRVLTSVHSVQLHRAEDRRPAPDRAYGLPLIDVGRRGKYLLVRFEPTTFVVHLMQGGRLLADDKLSAKPRGGQARFTFDAVERPRRLHSTSRHSCSPSRARSVVPACGACRQPTR